MFTTDNSNQYTQEVIRKVHDKIGTIDVLKKYMEKRIKEEPLLKELIENISSSMLDRITSHAGSPPPRYLAFNRKVLQVAMWSGVIMAEMLKKQIEIDHLEEIMRNE